MARANWPSGESSLPRLLAPRGQAFTPGAAGRYLDYAAVLHTRQGQGIGSLLLKRTLEAMRATEEFRAQRLPFLLTTSDPRNVPFYRRLGFEVCVWVCAQTCRSYGQPAGADTMTATGFPSGELVQLQ